LGDCLLSAGRLLESAAAYKRAIRNDPNNAEYIHSLAAVHINGGAFKQALEALAEAIRLSPKNSRYYCSRGLVQMGLKEVRAAIRDFNTAVALDPNNAHAHFLLADAYSNPDDPTYPSSFEAVEHAELAVKLTESRNPQYLMGLARAYRVARQYEKAVATAKKAIALDPNPEYRRELGLIEKDGGAGQK
jgi:tetratricopeptide (TPR) repeat protein